MSYLKPFADQRSAHCLHRFLHDTSQAYHMAMTHTKFVRSYLKIQKYFKRYLNNKNGRVDAYRKLLIRNIDKLVDAEEKAK